MLPEGRFFPILHVRSKCLEELAPPLSPLSFIRRKGFKSVLRETENNKGKMKNKKGERPIENIKEDIKFILV